MQIKTKDGNKTIDWLESRKSQLEEKDSVKWYIKYQKQSDQFKLELIQKYNNYLSDVKSSDPKKLYDDIRRAFKNHDGKSVLELSSVARQKLADGDFKMPPASYDPQRINYDFFVSQYISTLEEISKKHTFGKDSFSKSVFDALS